MYIFWGNLPLLQRCTNRLLQNYCFGIHFHISGWISYRNMQLSNLFCTSVSDSVGSYTGVAYNVLSTLMHAASTLPAHGQTNTQQFWSKAENIRKHKFDRKPPLACQMDRRAFRRHLVKIMSGPFSKLYPAKVMTTTWKIQTRKFLSAGGSFSSTFPGCNISTGSGLGGLGSIWSTPQWVVPWRSWCSTENWSSH